MSNEAPVQLPGALPDHAADTGPTQDNGLYTTSDSTSVIHRDTLTDEPSSDPAGSTGEADAASNSAAAASLPSNAALHAAILSHPASSPNSAPPSVPSSPPHSTSLIEDSELARLKAQIAELDSQVTSLNGKLVQSYNRVGGLEDDIHGKGMEVKELEGKVKRLEAERKTWEERYEGGLLVEKDHVQQELSRMMERVMEETAHRGKAENDKATIEAEVAELSSSLFQEANSMVAIERMERLRAERKMEQLDRNLKDTESMMTSQGDQMRDMGGKIDELEHEREEMRKRLEELEETLATAANSSQISVAGTEADDNASTISIRSEHIETPLSATFPTSQLPLPSTALVPTTPGSTSFATRALPSTIIHPIQHLSFDIIPFQEFVVFTKSLARIRKNITTRLIFEGNHPYAYGAYASPYTAQSLHNSQPSAGGLQMSASDQKEALANALPLSQYMDFPFIKRIATEDGEPSLRLDAAPGLTFFSRRQISTAIIDGNLAIEPAFTSIPSDQCALCGTSLQKFIASHQTTAPKDDPRKKLTRLATNWIPNAISGTSTPTKEQQQQSNRDSWSISALTDALQGALTPAKELGGFNFSIPGTSSGAEKERASSGHYTPYTGANSSRPGTSSGTGGGGGGAPPERRPSNLSRSSSSAFPDKRPSTAEGTEKDPHQGTFMLNSSARSHAVVYLFRSMESSTRYAVCPTYCLPRLRAVCELWTYVRTIEKGLLTEDNPKFYAGQPTGEYAQQVKKMTNALVPPQSATAVVKGLATPALGASRQLGVDGPSTPNAMGMAPLSKVSSNTSTTSNEESAATTGLGMDMGQKNASVESLWSTTNSTTTPAISASSAATSVENLSQASSGDKDLDRTPQTEKGQLASSTSSMPESNASGGDSRRPSMDQSAGNGDGFNLKLPPARPKRSVARGGTATPTSTASPTMPSFNNGTDNAGPSEVPAIEQTSATPVGSGTPRQPSPPSLPARSAAPPLSTSPSSAMLPPRLPARPALNRLSTGSTLNVNEQGGAVSTKQADWQQRCWYEIVRLKEVTFWARVGSTHDRH